MNDCNKCIAHNVIRCADYKSVSCKAMREIVSTVQTQQIYAYKVSWGVSEAHLNTSTKFMFITNDKQKADAYVEQYVADEIENEKHIDDDGNLVNHWWKCHKVEELPIEDDIFNVVLLK